jgi:protein phosphatase PTC7
VAARSDSVTDAVVGQVAVRTGDVVVAGTDGLFDNVLDDQLERAVQMGTKFSFSPKNMADIIAAVAYKRSNESSSRKLRKGKPDDITVLVAFIVPLGS